MPFKIFSVKSEASGTIEAQMNQWEQQAKPIFITHIAVGETIIVVRYEKTKTEYDE